MAATTKRILVAWLALGVLFAGAAPALAETTLEKIARTGTMVVGTRTASPPFGFIDKQNNWGGFSVDLAKLVHANVEKKLGKPIKFELKESTPATRIPLLTSGAVDLISGTMTITRARRDSLDFSAVFFVAIGMQIDARELWGGDRNPRDAVYLDLWEDYLEPA